MADTNLPVAASRFEARRLLNSRVSPELRARLRATRRAHGISIQQIVEESLVELLDALDIEALRDGTAVPPGAARPGHLGAVSVPLTVRIASSLRQRLDALTALFPEATLQGIVLEALEALPEVDQDAGRLWEIVTGGQQSPTPPPPLATKTKQRIEPSQPPAKRGAAKRSTAKSSAAKQAPLRRPGPRRGAPPTTTDRDATRKSAAGKDPTTASSRRAASKMAPAKKGAAKKGTAQKASAKKAPAKPTTA
jgi:hypothetical protein